MDWPATRAGSIVATSPAKRKTFEGVLPSPPPPPPPPPRPRRWFRWEEGCDDDAFGWLVRRGILATVSRKKSTRNILKLKLTPPTHLYISRCTFNRANPALGTRGCAIAIQHTATSPTHKPVISAKKDATCTAFTLAFTQAVAVAGNWRINRSLKLMLLTVTLADAATTSITFYQQYKRDYHRRCCGQ